MNSKVLLAKDMGMSLHGVVAHAGHKRSGKPKVSGNQVLFCFFVFFGLDKEG